MYYDSKMMTVILDVSNQKWMNSNGLSIEGFIEVSPFVAFGEQPRAPFFPIIPERIKDYFATKSDNLLPNIAKVLIQIHEFFFKFG